LFFFFYGFTFATWASRILISSKNFIYQKVVWEQCCLAMPVGSFLTLPFSGYFTAKIGSRKVVIFAAIIYTILLTAIGFAPNILLLTTCMFLFGSAGNMMNIAINTQAIALEKLYNRTIISSFHGMWSIAGLAAAALGTFLIGKAFPVAMHFMLSAAIALASFIFCMPYLLRDQAKQPGKRAFFTKPGKAFLGLGLIAFCSMICQGAMFDWSGVYFKKVVTTNVAQIGIGYTAFMVSMTFIRFITDWLTHRIGFTKIIALCGIFITIGLLINIFFPYILPATIGMLLVGVGVSPAVPLVFSAAARSKKMPAPVAIAAVSSIGFIGLLIGPPLIGFIAGLTSLKISFLVLSFFGIAISILAMLNARKVVETS
jgi:MFS family permease